MSEQIRQQRKRARIVPESGGPSPSYRRALDAGRAPRDPADARRRWSRAPFLHELTKRPVSIAASPRTRSHAACVAVTIPLSVDEQPRWSPSADVAYRVLEPADAACVRPAPGRRKPRTPCGPAVAFAWKRQPRPVGSCLDCDVGWGRGVDERRQERQPKLPGSPTRRLQRGRAGRGLD